MKNFKSIAISIAILWKYCNAYCKISKYYKISKVLQYFAILLEPPLAVPVMKLTVEKRFRDRSRHCESQIQTQEGSIGVDGKASSHSR